MRLPFVLLTVVLLVILEGSDTFSLPSIIRSNRKLIQNYKKTIQKAIVVGILSAGIVFPMNDALADSIVDASNNLPVQTSAINTLQDQLKQVQKEQLSQQTKYLNAQRLGDTSLRNDYVSGSQIAKAIITIPASKAGANPLDFPLGLQNAAMIDPAFDKEDAILACTAVGRQGTPVALKKVHTKDLKFPIFFELNTNDLMFPYTKEAWLASPMQSDNMALTCILDVDGKLSDPDKSSRYGFAVSAPLINDNPIITTNKNNDVIDIKNNKATRSEAKISIAFQSDGKPYTPEEKELMGNLEIASERAGYSDDIWKQLDSSN